MYELMKPFTRVYEDHFAPIAEQQARVVAKFVEAGMDHAKALRDAFVFAMEQWSNESCVHPV